MVPNPCWLRCSRLLQVRFLRNLQGCLQGSCWQRERCQVSDSRFRPLLSLRWIHCWHRTCSFWSCKYLPQLKTDNKTTSSCRLKLESRHLMLVPSPRLSVRAGQRLWTLKAGLVCTKVSTHFGQDKSPTLLWSSSPLKRLSELFMLMSSLLLVNHTPRTNSSELLS